MGFEIILVGRLLKDSVKIQRNYKIHRFKLFFNKGFLFYAEYNLRLFFWLLCNKANIYHANDLDTLLPMWLISKYRNLPLVYDSHEYFTGVSELQDRPFVKFFWKFIEKKIFPSLTNIVTVNNSIAKLYYDEYSILPKVVRNLPLKDTVKKVKSRESLGLPKDKNIIILQGAGINVDRGSEELLEAVANSDKYFLCVVGKGDVIPKLKARSKESDLLEKIIFIDTLPYDEMMQYTLNSEIGVSLDKDNNINHKYSLPNKIFDYLKANIPVLSSDLVEVSNILSTYKVGITISDVKPSLILEGLDKILKLREKAFFKDSITIAMEELNWDNESKVFRDIYRKLK